MCGCHEDGVRAMTNLHHVCVEEAGKDEVDVGGCGGGSERNQREEGVGDLEEGFED
jgi:hypothetical protein